MGKTLFGTLTILCWAVTVPLTMAVVWLGLISWEIVQIPFLISFLGGIALILLSRKIGMSRETVWHPLNLVVIAIGLLLLIAQSMFLTQAVGYAIESFDNALVGVLFAIYEETIMLGFTTLLIGAGVPDIITIICSVAFFVPMHALVYPATVFFDLFLTFGRVIMTGALMVSDNSDTSYAIHILWNLMNSF